MDALDINILSCLDSNARQSTSDIARSVRHGRDIVEYRIDKMIRGRVILKTRALIDPAATGKTVFKTYFKLQQLCSEIDALIEYLQRCEFVTCFAETMGGWDLIVNMVADSPHAFSECLKKITTQWHRLIREVRFSVITDYHAFSRPGTGAFKKNRAIFHTCGIARQPVLDPLDEKIITLLSQDARISLADISKITNAHVATVKSRIEDLEEKRIIVGYRTSVDRRALGMQVFKILIEDTAIDPKQLLKLREAVAHIPEILCFIEQVGLYTVEMNLEAKDYDSCDDVLNILFKSFEQIMKHSMVLLVRSEIFNTFSAPKKSPKKALQGAGMEV